MEKSKYKITKTDEELKELISKVKNNLSEDKFSDFCNIILTRASRCWQSGLEDYTFGEKRYNDWQSRKTVLEILDLEVKTGSYDSSYVLYIKESICLYHKIYLRENKLNRILKK